MFKTLDRYVIREMVLPFVLGLVVLTFLLQVPPFLQQSQNLIARGVPWSTVARALYMLLPQALSITIPMAVLLGILVAFGRLSADREFVALQACGVSLLRLLRPVALVAVLGTAATAYETIVALPNANQTFREITYGVVAQKIESEVKPQVFFTYFPNQIIYVRDLPAGGGWRDVFVADRQGGTTTVYFAREGRVVLDRAKRLVQLQLADGTSHTTTPGNHEAYQSTEFERISISLDPQSVFPPPPAKGAAEMTFAELRADIEELQRQGNPAYIDRFMVQQKLSLPATCLILALIGVALGASNRKDGKLASFVLGFGVILVYYVLLYGARAFATGGRLKPEWAPWIPNVIMGAAGVALMAWRVRAADRPFHLTIPAFWRRRAAARSDPPARPAAAGAAGDRARVVVKIRIPHVNLPAPKLLDVYLSRDYLRVFALSIVSLLGIFYISTFIDLVDKLFRGQTTTSMLVRYFYFQTPQFVYFIIPMAVLVSTLVTIGVLTKNNELVVFRACGISLYRTAAPLVLFGLAASGVLFMMQEKVLASANREADRLNRQIRSWPPLLSPEARRWVLGRRGDIYNYDAFDPAANRFTNLRAYRFDDLAWRLQSMTYAEEVTFDPRGPGGGTGDRWLARRGWVREFAPPRSEADAHIVVRYLPFAELELPVDPPGYFKSAVPDAEQMTYGELRAYIARLRASGSDVVPFLVALQRKVAFPLVTVIMTLIAVPFAVTTGRRGALYGIGVGIVLALVYWVALSVFGALGAGGLLSPILAAWAPNVLFSAVAMYGMLTVRT
jgi:LPS export ABC transporter permease LptG/LPS export ABC transporter permease LptF